MTSIDANPRTRAGAEPLLDAALEIVAEHGVNAVTVRAVAERAGVSPGTVSYHFATADELLVKALERGALQTAEMLERLALDLQSTDWDDETLVHAFAAAFARHLEEHRVRHLACFELQLLAARRPELVPQATNIHLAYARVGRMAALAYGVPDVDAFAIRMTAMVTGLTLTELVHRQPGAEERLATAMLDAMREAARAAT